MQAGYKNNGMLAYLKRNLSVRLLPAAMICWPASRASSFLITFVGTNVIASTAPSLKCIELDSREGKKDCQLLRTFVVFSSSCRLETSFLTTTIDLLLSKKQL